MNKLKELEKTSRAFRIGEYITLGVLLGIIILQTVFPHLLYQAYMMSNENCKLLNEKYNIYSIANLTEDQEEIYTEYIEYIFQNVPMYENDYTIYIVDDELDSLNPYTRSWLAQDYFITAITNKGYRTITLHKDWIALSLSHEVGHAVDNTYGFSKTKEFKELYAKVEHDEYLTGDIGEYFADGYEKFVEWGFNLTDDTELIEYYEKILGQEYQSVFRTRMADDSNTRDHDGASNRF